MSGDLGRPNKPILRDPELHPGVDAPRAREHLRRPRALLGRETRTALIDALSRTLDRGDA